MTTTTPLVETISSAPWRPGLRTWLFSALLVMAMGFHAGADVGGASAQSLKLGASEPGKPLEIYADEGIEWHKDSNAYIARGNARAIQGDVTIFADTLTAYYRKIAGNATRVSRIEAAGNVRIRSPTETAEGDNAVYDVDKAILVLTGRNLKFITATTKITARDSIEYWEAKQMAVARGNAIATQEDKKLRADTLVAYFQKTKAKGKGKSQGTEIYRIDAFDNVSITTPTDVAYGKQGVYNVITGIATLTGGVRITRGQNQLNGEIAEINMNTGISRILSGFDKDGKPKPVRALIVPEQKKNKRSGNVKK